jgi:hypothetical protein
VDAVDLKLEAGEIHYSHPRRQVSSSAESASVTNGSKQRSRSHRTDAGNGSEPVTHLALAGNALDYPSCSASPSDASKPLAIIGIVGG